MGGEWLSALTQLQLISKAQAQFFLFFFNFDETYVGNVLINEVYTGYFWCSLQKTVTPGPLRDDTTGVSSLLTCLM